MDQNAAEDTGLLKQPINDAPAPVPVAAATAAAVPVNAQPVQQPMYHATAVAAQPPVGGPGMHPGVVPPPPGLLQAQVLLETVPQGQWTSECWDCFQNVVPSCLMSMCCPCIQLGQICNVLQIADCWVVVCCSVVLTILAGGANVIFIVASTFVVRMRARETFHIDGNCCFDLLLSIFCTCCTISQLARHIYQYEEAVDSCACNDDGVTESVSNRLRREAGRRVQAGHVQSQQVQAQQQAQQAATNPMHHANAVPAAGMMGGTTGGGYSAPAPTAQPGMGMGMPTGTAATQGQTQAADSDSRSQASAPPADGSDKV